MKLAQTIFSIERICKRLTTVGNWINGILQEEINLFLRGRSMTSEGGIKDGGTVKRKKIL